MSNVRSHAIAWKLLNSGELASLNLTTSLNYVLYASLSKQKRHESKKYIGSLKSSNVTLQENTENYSNVTDVKVSYFKINLPYEMLGSSVARVSFCVVSWPVLGL